MTYGEISCTVVFNYGIFSALARLSPEGLADLRTVAAQLKGHMSRFTLIVEGHTDNVPLSSRSRYKSNFQLGTERAEAATEALTKRFGLPIDSVFPTSAGETDPPFPNNSTANRRRNRTVILKIVPKISERRAGR